MKENRIFISGKITGEPIGDCVSKFINYRDHLFYQKKFSIDRIIIPLNIIGIHFGISHEKAMELCFAELKNCTHIYMLKDWKESKGAIMEHQFALDNNIKIIYQK